MKYTTSLFCFLWLGCGGMLPLSLWGGAPSRLMTDLMEHTDRVWIEGYPSQVTLDQVGHTLEPLRFVEIGSRTPSFSWQVNDERPNVMQTAYHLQVASSAALLQADSADLWDSGEQASPASVAVAYAGAELQPSTLYYWRVRTYNNNDPQPWSAIRAFRTAAQLESYRTPVYPLEKRNDWPQCVTSPTEKVRLADFGQATFGQLMLTLRAATEDTVIVRLGECLKAGRVDSNPGGSRRYQALRLPVMPGLHTYKIKIPADQRNTGDRAIAMPSEIGEVYPFRYVEVEGRAVQEGEGVLEWMRQSVNYPFDDCEATFRSSDMTLNRVWALCKESIRVTSFAGTYVDGDRERIPYEADALINQLAHYCTDREYSMARHTHEYLLTHATWPTEWILQSVLLAWYDYLYTGDLRAVKAHYETLHHKTLLALADERGFITVAEAKQTPELLKSIHLYGGQKLQNIVDWPHTGQLGLEKAEGGEADGYVFTEVNTVVNAYHYYALTRMAQMAQLIGAVSDAQKYSAAAAKLRKVFNAELYDRNAGAYRDGIGTDHHALHASMFPLAFGMVEPRDVPKVVEFIRSRGMACSVYGSQFLLDGLYDYGAAAAYGLELLSSTAERSWYNMIRVGSTVSLEAWDNKYKPNQDWNHAWGAAPANLIPRKLMGVEPIEAGFARVRIAPQPDTLFWADAVVPTIRGAVKVAWQQQDGGLVLQVEIPANMQAEVCVPMPQQVKRYALRQDGKPLTRSVRAAQGVLIPHVGSGRHTFELTW
ncbi:MAG: alpha-L-rhamnosidase C-terminal domain-containing protein [Alistipes sp.]|nr:alpha-L-rhamnosidase C-terminal domain-containing protein [Alistipes sp.]